MAADKLTKGQQTRQNILRTAHQLFIEQGYHGTSMRQIAQDAGIALSSIYNHFAGKEEIFTAVFDAYHPYHEILPAIRNAPVETVESFVHGAATHMIEALKHRPGFLNLVFIELVEFEGQHLPALYDVIYPQLEGLVRRFPHNSPELRPIQVPVLLRAFLGLFFSYVLSEMILGGQFPDVPPDKMLDNLIDIYLYGVLTRV